MNKITYRGPKDPDDYRIEARRSRHYWDTLPACELRPEGPMTDRLTEALPAQSTLMKAIPSDALLYWAVGKTAEYAVDQREKWQGLDRDDAVDVLKKSHQKESTKAANRGTGVHEYLDAKLRGEPFDLTYLDENAALYLPVVDQFLAEQEPELVLSEVVGIGVSHGVTTDAIIRFPKLDVEQAVVDWKTRNDTVKKPHVVYEKEVFQLGANTDLRYLIVEDVESGRPFRIPVPVYDAAVLVTFTTTGYALHKVDVDEAVEHFRGLLAWHSTYKTVTKAVKGKKLHELKISAPTPEAPAATDPVETSGPVPEENVATDSSGTTDDSIRGTLRGRAAKLIEAGHEAKLVELWPAGVPGISDASDTGLLLIEKAVQRCETAVSAPFDPAPTELPPTRFAPSTIIYPTVELDEGPIPVGDDDVDTVRAAWALLDDEQSGWLRRIAGEVGNLSMTELPSGRRVRIGWSLVRLAAAGWHDDALLEAALEHAHSLTMRGDPVGVLKTLDFHGAGRLSATVGELVEGSLTFSVTDGGSMRLEAA